MLTKCTSALSLSSPYLIYACTIEEENIKNTFQLHSILSSRVGHKIHVMLGWVMKSTSWWGGVDHEMHVMLRQAMVS